MSPIRRCINELTERPGPYTVKVKVVQKWRPTKSPRKTKFQKFVLQDDKGDEIQATVFGDDVECYDKKIHQHKEYEISNAPLKLMKEELQSRPNELEMHFNTNTIIRPLSHPTIDDELPSYQDLASIDPVPRRKEFYDILGVVLLVDQKRSVKKQGHTREYDVREFVIIDQSIEHPITISAWGDLACKDCEQLNAIAETFPIIGITSLQGSSYGGFSFATSMSTRIIFEPRGEKCASLISWTKSHFAFLESMRNKLKAVRLSKLEPNFISVADLNNKQVSETLPDEKIWLSGNIFFEKGMVKMYLGCNHCGRKCDADKGKSYQCNWGYCKNKSSVSIPRLTLNFHFTDETDTLSLTAFTEHAEKILGRSAECLYNMSYEEYETFFCQACEERGKTPIFIQVVPASSLAHSKILKWLLNCVSYESPKFP